MPSSPRRVLFLPGASGDPRFWAPVAERLPPAWERVLLGWPGLGDVPPSPAVTGMADLVALTLERMDRPVDLVAQSMGGVVAIQAALARPALVRRLVLAATSGGVDLARFGAEDWRAEYRREYPHAAPWILGRPPDLEADLPRIAAPTLLVWGSADRISPVTVGAHLARVLPRAELVVIPGGEHMCARDRASEVVPHVLRHLAAGE